MNQQSEQTNTPWREENTPITPTNLESEISQLEPAGLIPSPKGLGDLRVLTMPAGGADRLNFTVWDTIDVFGYGEDTVELKGHYVIERANPTSSNWAEASVNIVMREMEVSGVSKLFGPVRAFINKQIGIQSQGQVRPGTVYPGLLDSPKMCIMEGYMAFEVTDLPIKLFNKQPIILQHNITHIPPIGQGGGTRDGVSVDLYLVNDPNAKPVASLKRVKTHIGAWQ